MVTGQRGYLDSLTDKTHEVGIQDPVFQVVHHAV